MDNTRLVSGHPYGGCGILWKSDITSKVTPLPSDSQYKINFRCVWFTCLVS